MLNAQCADGYAKSLVNSGRVGAWSEVSAKKDKLTKVLFVCLGNICRSPTAEGVFRDLLVRRGLADKILVDSAGTSGWHVGEAPDARSQQEALRRGVDLSEQRSRAVAPSDFERFDYIVAMDGDNLRELKKRCPKELQSRLYLCTEFAPGLGLRDVPDPYYGGADGFARVFEIIAESTRGLLATIEDDGNV